MINFIKKTILSLIMFSIFIIITVDAKSEIGLNDSKSISELERENVIKAIKENAVVAVVNGEKILIRDLKNSYEDLPSYMKNTTTFENLIIDKKAYQSLLDREVSLKLAYQNGIKCNLDKDEKIKRRVKQCQLAVVQKAYIEKRACEALSQNNEEELRKNYRELEKSTPRGEYQVILKMITVKNESEAKRILERIKNGENFGSLAKQTSSHPSKDHNGNLGIWIGKSELQQLGFSMEAIYDILRASKGTQLNKVYKLSDKKFGIFYIEDKRPYSLPPFEEIKEELRSALIPQKATEIIFQEIKESEKRGDIKRFDLNGNLIKLSITN